MKKEKIIGIVLILIGLFMLFKSARVHSFGFYRFGQISTAGIVLVLLVISGVAFVVKQNIITKICLIASVAALALSLILGTQISFMYMSLLDILLILIPIVVGLGLMVKSYLDKK